VGSNASEDVAMSRDNAAGAGRTPAARPRIGITTYREPATWGIWSGEATLLPSQYPDAVWRAGGVPVLLPPVPGAVRAVDGLVLAGGGDVDPALYAATPHPLTGGVLPDRDAWEVEILRAALAERVPVLGVCRGMQVLNVVLGGTLHQHLPDVVAHDEHRPSPGTFGDVGVQVLDGRLRRVLGDRTEVRCHHHQALDRIGDGLRVVARAGDGTVEAVERDGDGFVVGVQWHPEEIGDDVRVLRALVDAARERGETAGQQGTTDGGH
jgi:gamma-glutamyl-gamma-aminobutyrate hydrolase PuuD